MYLYVQKHCTIGLCIGTHIFPTNKFWTTNKVELSLSSLIYFGQRGGGSPHSRYFSSLPSSPLILHFFFFFFSSLSLHFSNFLKKDHGGSLKTSTSWRVEDLEGKEQTQEEQEELSSLPSPSSPSFGLWVFFGSQEHKVRKYMPFYSLKSIPKNDFVLELLGLTLAQFGTFSS